MKFINLFVLLILAFGYGCQKDDHTDLPHQCKDQPNLSISYFTEERYQFKSPFFNPLNGDEICFHFKDNAQQAYTISRYNLVSGESLDLAINVRNTSKPVWSVTGWVAFNKTETGQIWKVKENGDSLTQITENVYNAFPVWGAQGEILYYRHTPINGIPYYFFGNNMDGQVDTLLQNGDAHNGYVRYSAVNPENLVIAETFLNEEGVIGISNIQEGPLVFRKLFSKDEADFAGLSDLCITPNGLKSYASVYLHGIYEIDNSDGTFRKIINHCWNRRYNKISISPDGMKLVGELVESYIEYDKNNNPTGNIIEQSSIYLIDLESLEETKVTITR